ncbi:MAG: hypothetical protein CMB73_06015 [Euryarchaeota archaeon]|nr:hypothetical protein [Euryarchaeota archaeon]
MKEIAKSTLESAIKENDELGSLFIEDQFRHIVVSELNKKTTIGGNFKPGDSYPKIVLEFMWRKGGKKMDIAILSNSTKGKSDRYSYPKNNPQPLAIELKVNGKKEGVSRDVTRVRNFLKPGGNSTFKNGMMLVGSKTDYRPRPDAISSKETGFLFGCIGEDNKPFIRWLKRPQSKKKKGTKMKTNKSSPKVYKCEAKWIRSGKICGDPCGGRRTKYCAYHSSPSKRR